MSMAADIARRRHLMAPVPRGAKVVEVGGAFAPLAPRADGWNLRCIDTASQQQLIERFGQLAGVDVTRIEPVDWLWQGGPLSAVVPAAEHGSFDAFVASHVIEHAPDLLGFLQSAEALVRPEGVVVLAVPDKRYCFDYFMPHSTTGQALAAHHAQRDRHDLGALFEHMAHGASADGRHAWGQHPVRQLAFNHTLEQAHNLFRAAAANPVPYHDVHGWHFTPASFALLLLELARLGLTDLRIDRLEGPTGSEFHAWLRRGGRDRAMLPEATLQEQRLMLARRILQEQGEQLAWLEPAAPLPEAPAHVAAMPGFGNGVQMFEGMWSSAVPGFPTGQAALFEDARIDWFEQRLGGFAGRRVLELGPLEGGHSRMMAQRGAQVLAIESNRAAYLRCLVAKEALGDSSARFMLGDFRAWLAETTERYDFLLASGVLYHMTDPVRLLLDMARVADRIGLWTHYFDANALAANPALHSRLDQPAVPLVTPRGRSVTLHGQRYGAALDWAGFCGGDAATSNWLSRDDILGVLADEGFHCETAMEHPDHPNGPAFCIYAERR